MPLNPLNFQKSLKNTGHVPGLDGIRGIAVLIVMIYHCGIYFNDYFHGGVIGVDIFFVLSGFLITSLIVREFINTSSFSFANFYIRRFLRLAPALLLVLLFVSLINLVIYDWQKLISNLAAVSITLFSASNFSIMFKIYDLGYLATTWSLSIEEQFYLLWPVTLFILLRTIPNRFALATVALALTLLAGWVRGYMIINDYSFVRIYYGLDTRAVALMIGCVLGIVLSFELLNPRLIGVTSRWLTVISPLGVMCLPLISLYINLPDKYMRTPDTSTYWGLFAVEIISAIIILDISINNRSIVHRLFSIKWLGWIGSISYGLYLWHYPLLLLFKRLGFNQLQIVIFGTLATFLIATSSFYFIEKPVLKLKNTYGGM